MAATVEGFIESKDLYSSISGVSFKIPVNSTSTNDTIRDYKIINSFFNTMISTEFITGKIISLQKNGKGTWQISCTNDMGAAGTLKWIKDGGVTGQGRDYNDNKVKFTVSSQG